MPQIFPSALEIEKTQAAIALHVARLDQHPDRRVGAYPYALLHAAGDAIHGTVLMFHGFSAKPHQMWRLADYLFRNGFNVYQAGLAGHGQINPALHWPQVDLRAEIALPLKAKIAQDPGLQAYLANFAQGERPNRLQRLALMARLMLLEPRLPDILKAVESPTSADFDRYYVSSHRQYLVEAEARLADLSAMPGPIYTLGLSVGGTVALALAAAHPDRIERVVAYAPLLRIFGEDRRQYVNAAGPLDIQEMGWDPSLQFPVGCFTAADRLGGEVLRLAQQLRTIPTCLVLTENEDAADIATNQRFFQQIGGEACGHRSYLYPAADLVPHPMVDPTEVSQRMSNRFWQSLYQESLRFLISGEIDAANLATEAQNQDLAAVPAVSV
jgi:alpha-beta hydrolase superfamily lysophospholipase